MDSGTMDWTVIGVGIALAGLMLVTTRSIRAEIRDIRAELRDIRAEMKALEDRLNKRIDELSERVSRLEQSQAHTAGLIEGIRESLFDRARRVSTGDRVVESSESYEPEGWWAGKLQCISRLPN